MNAWVEKSLEIAERGQYLDDLSAIYPAAMGPSRPLEPSVREAIRGLHDRRKGTELLKTLLTATDQDHPFPIEHPYASIFRQKPDLLDRNPRVQDELVRTLLSLPVDSIIRGVERPVDINRSMGQRFQNWLKTYFTSRSIPFLPEAGFRLGKGPAFLDGRDKRIMDFVAKQLHFNLGKGRDFLYKTGRGEPFVVGEARFLSTSGGSQSRDLNETIQFIKGTKGKIIGVGVVDGIVWFDDTYRQRLSDLAEDEPAMTALLLEDFLRSLG